jgi:hypothetical protein
MVAQDRGESVGRESLEEIQRGNRRGGGASRRNSPGGAGRPVQLSGTGESKGQCATDGQLRGREDGGLRVCSELAFLMMREKERRQQQRVGDENGTANKPAACCGRFCFRAGLAPL